MLVAGNWHAVNKIREHLDDLTAKGVLTITVRETQRRAPEESAPYVIDVVALDHEGIVTRLSGFLAGRNLEIAELNTRRYNAPHTGAAMFGAQFTINVPASVHIASLREEFLAYCDEENLDAVIEPAQR